MRNIYKKSKHFLALFLVLSLIMQMGGILTFSSVFADDNTDGESPKDLGNIFTSVKLTVNGEEVSEDSTIEINEDTTVRLDYNWELNDSVNLQPGDWAQISIPNEFVPFKDEDGDLLNDKNEVVGTYHLDKNNKTLRVEFNNTLVEKIQRKGNVWFNFEFDLQEFDEDTSQKISFNDTTNKSFIITLKPQGNNPIIDKKGETNTSINPTHITWTIDINKSLDELNGVKVEDNLPIGLETQSIEIYDLTIGYDGTVTGETLSSLVASGFPIDLGYINSAYRIKYTTKIIDNSKLNFKNEAIITSDNNSTNKSDATVGITRGNFIEKKNGNPNKNRNATEIDWTINVNEAETSIVNAKVTDQLPNGLTIKSESIKIYKLAFDSNGNEVLGEEVTDSNIVGNGDSFEISLGDINEAYQIRYTTDINYGEYQRDNNFVNTATISGDNIENKTDTGEVTVRRDSLLEKQGNATVNYQDKKIYWTIHVNKAYANIENAILIDTIGDGLELINGTLEVYDSDNKLVDNLNITMASNGFNIDFGDINSYYKVVYETNITDFNQDKFSNKVELSGDGIGVGVDKIEINKTLDPTIQNYYEKNRNGINYDTKEMSWRLSIKPVKEKITELKIRDTFPNNGLVFLEDSLSFEGFSKELVKDTDYTVTPIDGGYEKGFIIEFKNTILPLEGSDYYINYKTSFDPDYQGMITNNTRKYINSANFLGKTEYNNEESPLDVVSSDFYNINWTAYNNGEKEGNLNREERKINWKLFLDYMAKDYSEFIVEDTLSEGQVIDLDSFIIKEYSVSSNGSIQETENILDSSEYTIEKTDEGFKLTFINGIDKPYLVEYTTNIKGISKADYSNTAKVTGNNTYTKSINYPNHDGFVVKEATNVEDNTVYTDDEINWKVTINESLSDIEPNSVFTDTISEGLVYIQDSLVVYDKSDDSELIKDVDYTLEINQLAEGETEFKLVFLNKINSIHEITYDTVVISETGKVKNNASYSGEKIVGDHNSSVEYVAKQTSGGTGSGINRGSIVIDKIDGETNELLSGAEFELYYMLNGEERLVGNKTYTTTEEKLEINNLPFRTYYLREINPPEGYEIGSKSEMKIIVDSSEPIEKKIENYKKGSIEIEKIDGDTSKPLSGAKFEIRDNNGNLIETLVTDENGKVKFIDLPRGKYTIEEVEAPEGYVIDNTKHGIEINAENLNIIKTVENLKRGSIIINKIDGDTEESIEAKFELYYMEDGEEIVVEKLMTKEGILEFKNLPFRTYYLRELSAPPGYNLVEDMEIVVDTNNPIEKTIKNYQRGIIVIEKIDGDTNKTIEAEFELYYMEDGREVLVDKLMTDEGILEFKNLPFRTYYLREVSAPEGYSLVEDIEIVVDTNTPIKKVIGNYIRGSIEIVKIEKDTDKTLTGAKFHIKDDEGYLLETVATGDDGKAKIENLPTGEYTIEEVEAPKGYIIDNKKHIVNIKKDDLNKIVEIENELEYTSMVAGELDVIEDGSLPQTGEKSKSIFYISGLLLILAGAVLWKKMK